MEFKIERTDLSLCPLADKMLRAYEMYCMESFNPLGVWWHRKKHPDLVRGQLSDAFLKEGEYVGILYFVLQNLLLNFVTKPDFVAYNHHYPEILSRKLCRGLYHNTSRMDHQEPEGTGRSERVRYFHLRQFCTGSGKVEKTA